MAETADYSPGDWKGHDFKDARKAYDSHVGRSYGDATRAGKAAGDLFPSVLKTPCSAPVIVACDVTGSMGDWPATMFSKLPYLDIEGKTYLGPDMHLSFAAIGDHKSDKYPFQARPFTTGVKLADQLKELVIEGGGGGNACESYELAALYFARNVEMPNATKPILIFIGDEAMEDFITKADARAHVKVEIEGAKIDTKAVFAELHRKYSVYGIRKKYTSGTEEPRIHKQWCDLIGADRIAMLQSADRVVDVIFGIFARETDQIDYFRKEIEGRQEPDKVDTVYKSLKTIHMIAESTDGDAKPAARKAKGKSILLKDAPEDVKKSRLLLPGGKDK